MENNSVQVLVSTMDRYDYELIKKLNLQSDAIVANQNGLELKKDIIIDNNKIEIGRAHV